MVARGGLPDAHGGREVSGRTTPRAAFAVFTLAPQQFAIAQAPLRQVVL